MPDSLSGSVEFVEYKNYHDEKALDRACGGCDAVICADAVIPEVIVEGQLFLLRAADRAGIARFVPASWNGDYRRLELGDMDSYDPHIAFRTQSQLESNIKPIYMLTGAFSEVLLGSYHATKESNPWRPDIQQLEIWGTGNERVAISTMRDSADWTIRVLKWEDAVDGGDWFSFSSRVSFRELASAFKTVTGDEMQEIERGTLEDLAKIEREKSG